MTSYALYLTVVVLTNIWNRERDVEVSYIFDWDHLKFHLHGQKNFTQIKRLFLVLFGEIEHVLLCFYGVLA